MAPSLPFPQKEIDELRALSAISQQSTTAPAECGIGFRRNLMAFTLPGGWSIRLPGYFYSSIETNGDTVYWFDNRSVHITTLSTSGKGDGQPIEPEELLTTFRRRILSEGQDVTEIAHHGIHGFAATSQAHGDDGDYWLLKGAWATQNRICVLTIVFGEQSQEEWALQTWQSINSPWS